MSGSDDSTSFSVEQSALDNNCHVSSGAGIVPMMSSDPSSDVVAQCSSSVKTMTVDAVSLPLASSAHTVHSSHTEMISVGNVYENRRTSGPLPAKVRIRRTQLKMLADNLSKFYAPATGGKRREMLAKRRSAMDVQRSARERQLEVIRKQVSLIEKRKKVELEIAAVTSLGDVSESDSQPVHTAVDKSTKAGSRRKAATALLNTLQSRKLDRWKSERKKHALQKLARRPAERHKACVTSVSESMSLHVYLLVK